MATRKSLIDIWGDDGQKSRERRAVPDTETLLDTVGKALHDTVLHSEAQRGKTLYGKA